MSDTNVPVLYQNIMYGLPNDLARSVFLWATDRIKWDHGCYRAEKFAREVAQAGAAGSGGYMQAI